MFKWWNDRKDLIRQKELIEDRWDELSTFYGRFDTETMDDHHPYKKDIYRRLNSKIYDLRTNKLKNVRTELEYRSYLSLRWDLFKEILNSNLIYEYHTEKWTFECPYRTLQKFDQNQFGPISCTHILYPSEKAGC